MVKIISSTKLSPAKKGILAGLLLALLVTIAMHGMYNAFYAIPAPNYELPDLPDANGWEFSTGLQLSAQIYDQADNLVSFFIAPGSSKDYFKGIDVIWGTIEPETYPTIYTFPLHNNNYDIGFNVQTTSSIYKDVHTSVSPDDLEELNLGLVYLLNSQSQFVSLTYNEYKAGIEDYFVNMPDYPNTQDGLRIEHVYSDGAMFQFRVLGDNVFVMFSHMDEMVFDYHKTGLYSISNEFDESTSAFYSINISNINIQAYIDNVNYLWYSLSQVN